MKKRIIRAMVTLLLLIIIVVEVCACNLKIISGVLYDKCFREEKDAITIMTVRTGKNAVILPQTVHTDAKYLLETRGKYERTV